MDEGCERREGKCETRRRRNSFSPLSVEMKSYVEIPDDLVLSRKSF